MAKEKKENNGPSYIDMINAIQNSLRSKSISEENKVLMDNLFPGVVLNLFYDFDCFGIVNFLNNNVNNYSLYQLKTSDIIQMIIDNVKNYKINGFLKAYTKKKNPDNIVIKDKKIKVNDINQKELNLYVDICKRYGNETTLEMLNIDNKKIKKEKMSTKEKELMKTSTINIMEGKINSVQIDEKYYTQEYMLIDIQRKNFNILNYLFLNLRTMKKEIVPIAHIPYYYKLKPEITMSKPIEKIENCNLISGNPKNEVNLIPLFEADVDSKTRHSVDYFYTRKTPLPENYNIPTCYVDIETTNDSDEEIDMLDLHNCEGTINMIGYHIGETFYINVIGDEDEITVSNIKEKYKSKQDLIEGIDKWEITVCNSEKQVVELFLKDLHDHNIFLITAWNLAFDITYIIKKAEQHRLTNYLEKYGPYTLNVKEDRIDYDISGFICIDLLDCYKGITQGERESYKLAEIAKDELDIEKLEMNDDIIDLIVYNRRDVEIIKRLDEEKIILKFYNMLRTISNTHWSAIFGQMGLIEGLILGYLKKNDLVIRNRLGSASGITNNNDFNSMSITGGYCQSCKRGGIKKYVIDMDASSMYPSLIRTYNISPNTLVYTIDPAVMNDILWKKDQINLDQQIKVIHNENEYDVVTGHNTELFMTIRELLKSIEENKYIPTLSGGIYKNHSDELALFYTLCNNLANDRKDVRKKEKQEKDKIMKATYYAIQYALKVLNNAIYGITGYDKFRGYCLTLSNSITTSGREIGKSVLCGIEYNYAKFKKEKNYSVENLLPFDELRKIVNKVTKFELADDMNFKTAFYSDTDSSFIELKNHIQTKEPVKEIYEKHVPLIEGIIQNTIQGIYGLHGNTISKENQFMDYKNEWIGLTGLFYKNKKKRYAVHIISKNKEECNELEVKGLEIRRSDYPKLTRERLTTLLEKTLIDLCTLSEIFSYSDKTRKEIFELVKKADPNVCKPIRLGKNIEMYKTLSAHIKGIIIWNKLFPMKPFRRGDKGYLVFINGIDQMFLDDNSVPEKIQAICDHYKIKSDAICFPESEILPKYFIIDNKRMMDYAWLDRHANLLEPLIQVEDEWGSNDGF